MRKARVLSLGLLCLLAAGCLDFEKQTLLLKVSPDGKSAKCLLVYEGLCVAGDDAGSLERAKDQLGRLATSGQSFYLLRSGIDLTEEPTAPVEDNARKAAIKKLLVIKSESFFQDKDGKLGLWQTLSTNDFPALMKELNGAAADLLAFAAKQQRERTERGEISDDLNVDEDTLKLWEKAPKAGNTLLAWKASQFRFLIPASQGGALAIENACKSNPESWAQVKRDYALKLALTDQGAEFTLGEAGSATLRLAIAEEKNGNQDQKSRLHEHARTLPLVFSQGTTAEKLIADFLAKK